MLSLAVVVVAAVLLVHRPQRAVLPSDRPGAGRSEPGSTDPADRRADAAAALLDRLAARLESGSRAQVSALAAPGDGRARRELATLRDNVRALGVTGVSLRYVEEDAAAAGTTGRTWVGDVQVGWRLRGFDRHEAHRDVALTFREDGARARFVTARRGTAGQDATPLWMLGPVFVERGPRTLVATTRAATTRRFSRLAEQAVTDVRRVLGGWRGRLVVEVPADQHGLTRVLGSEPGAYGEIAAVTTTVDGSQSPLAPVHIFVNPRVFDPLGPRGSQIVMSHEATHVATGAALSTMPTWLLEGFADYVALAHVDLPVTVTAGQILGQVRRAGPPRHLPGKAEFAPTNKQLGASYESAWLAARLLGERYGERRLLAFYRATERTSSTAGPFRTVLGTDQRAFTRAWREDLRRLAR